MSQIYEKRHNEKLMWPSQDQFIALVHYGMINDDLFSPCDNE